MPKEDAANPGSLPDLERTTVTLPWEAFKDLLQPASPEEPTPPPHPAVVTRAAYVGRVDGPSVVFTATFEVTVLAEGWVEVPLLPCDGIALQKARLDKKDTALFRVQDEAYGLCVQGPGQFAVALDFAVAVSDPDAPDRFELPLRPVPVSVLELTLPGKELDVTIEPSFGLRREASRDATKVRCALGTAEHLDVQWQAAEKAESKVRVLPLLSSESATLVAIADRVMTLLSRVHLSIQKAPIDSLCVALPEGVTFLAAEGDIVREWEVEGAAPNQRVRIHFQYEHKGDCQLALRAERVLGDAEQVQVPPLVLLWDKALHQARVEGKPEPKGDAKVDPKAAPEPLERQRGVLALCAEPRCELKLGKAQNLVPMDVKELPPTVPQAPHPLLFALRYARVPFALALHVASHDDVAVLVAAIDHAHMEVLALEDGRLLAKALLNIRNNSRQFLKVKLPPGAALWSSFRSNRPVKPAADAEGVVRIPLSKSGESAPYTVELAYLVQGQPYGNGGPREAQLPRFDLPVSFYSLQLYLPRRYRHFNFEGSLKRVEALSRTHTYLAHASDQGGGGASNLMAQTVLQPPPSGGPEGDAAGQLPIRIPMVRRGLEARFEKTLVVDEQLSLKWECKRRKNDGF